MIPWRAFLRAAVWRRSGDGPPNDYYFVLEGGPSKLRLGGGVRRRPNPEPSITAPFPPSRSGSDSETGNAAEDARMSD
jgi:hypothetical protein